MNKRIRIFDCIKEMEKAANKRLDDGFIITEMNISQSPYSQSFVTLKKNETMLRYMVGAPHSEKQSRKKKKR
jgi:hypothetical protein